MDVIAKDSGQNKSLQPLPIFNLRRFHTSNNAWAKGAAVGWRVLCYIVNTQKYDSRVSTAGGSLLQRS